MTTPSHSVHRAAASLELPGTVPALITYAQGIVRGMTDNTAFPAPAPSMATVTNGVFSTQIAASGCNGG
jgi:hypothetical protein